MTNVTFSFHFLQDMTFSVIPIFHTGETLSTVWKWVFLVYQNRKSCFAWIFICPRQTNAFFSSFSFVKMMKRKKKSYFKMHQQFNPSSTVNSFFSHTIFSVSYLFSWRWGRYVMEFFPVCIYLRQNANNSNRLEMFLVISQHISLE